MKEERPRKVVGGRTIDDDGVLKKINPPVEEKTIDVLKKQAKIDDKSEAKTKEEDNYLDGTQNAIKNFDPKKAFNKKPVAKPKPVIEEVSEEVSKTMAQHPKSSGMSADDYDVADV